MTGNRRSHRWMSVVAVLCAVAQSGCASWEFPRIDPTGQRIFVPGGQPAAPLGPPPPYIAPGPLGAGGGLAPLTNVPPPGPVAVVQPAPSMVVQPPPQNLVPSPPGNVLQPAPGPLASPPPVAPSAPIVSAPIVSAPIVSAPIVSGPPLPPPGVALGPPQPVAGRPPSAPFVALPTDRLAIAPREFIAPIGGEIVVVATVTGGDGLPKAHETVEWNLAAEGVGQFVQLGEGGPAGSFLFPGNSARKVDSFLAIGQTAGAAQTITRGTPYPGDDIAIGRGQSWISVTSPVEGTSYVTALASSVPGWDRRRETSTIHWVDAQWVFPPPTTGSSGEPRTVSTTVMRLSDGSPVSGWSVRYELLGPAAATLGPGGETTVEVPTNELGQASIEVAPLDALGGTTQVGVQIIRPQLAGAVDSRRLILAGSVTSVAWASATTAAPVPVEPPITPSQPPPVTTTPPQGPLPSIELQVNGAPTAEVGGLASFELVIRNIGPQVARGLVISDRFDSGLDHFEGASPIRFNLEDLPPGATTSVPLTFTVLRAGQLCHTVEILTNDEAFLTSGAACVTGVQAAAAPVGAANLSVTSAAPLRAELGALVEIEIELRNNGAAPLLNLRVVDVFDASLTPIRATRGADDSVAGEISWLIDRLEPGQTRRLVVECECSGVTQQACGRVTVTALQQVVGSAQSCLEIAPQPQAPPDLPADVAPPAALSISRLQLRAPPSLGVLQVGDEVQLRIDIENLGDASDREVLLAISFPAALRLQDGGVAGPGEVQYTVENTEGGLTFRSTPAIREIRARETISFSLRFTAVAATSGQIVSQISSARLTRPLTAQTTVTVQGSPPAP